MYFAQDERGRMREQIITRTQNWTMLRYWVLVCSVESKLEIKLVVSLSCRLWIARHKGVIIKNKIKKNLMWNNVKQNSCKLVDTCPAINSYLGWLPSKPSDFQHTFEHFCHCLQILLTIILQKSFKHSYYTSQNNELYKIKYLSGNV
jgi:hypothetical protein